MENFFDTYHCHVFHPVRHIEVLFQSLYDVLWMSNGLVEGLRRVKADPYFPWFGGRWLYFSYDHVRYPVSRFRNSYQLAGGFIGV